VSALFLLVAINGGLLVWNVHTAICQKLAWANILRIQNRADQILRSALNELTDPDAAPPSSAQPENP
jgi:hypothetical protein